MPFPTVIQPMFCCREAARAGVSFMRSCQPPHAHRVWGSERRLEFCFVVCLPFYCFSLWRLWVFVSMLGLSLAAASRGRSLAVERRLQAHGLQYLGVCT